MAPVVMAKASAGIDRGELNPDGDASGDCEELEEATVRNIPLWDLDA